MHRVPGLAARRNEITRGSNQHPLLSPPLYLDEGSFGGRAPDGGVQRPFGAISRAPDLFLEPVADKQQKCRASSQPSLSSRSLSATGC
jgi:hypothetical protein